MEEGEVMVVGGGWWGCRRAMIVGEEEVSRVRRCGEGEREVD